MRSPQKLDARVRRTREDVSRVAAELLIHNGWDSVTHVSVSERSGYARATLYKHWPKPHDLVRAAFSHLGTAPHGTPQGSLRGDLVSELEAFRNVLVEQKFARALAALAERACADSDIAAVRDSFCRDGQKILTERLTKAGVSREIQPDHARMLADMLSGALVWRVVMTGEHVDLRYVERLVDVALANRAQT